MCADAAKNNYLSVAESFGYKSKLGTPMVRWLILKNRLKSVVPGLEF